MRVHDGRRVNSNKQISQIRPHNRCSPSSGFDPCLVQPGPCEASEIEGVTRIDRHQDDAYLLAARPRAQVVALRTPLHSVAASRLRIPMREVWLRRCSSYLSCRVLCCSLNSGGSDRDGNGPSVALQSSGRSPPLTTSPEVLPIRALRAADSPAPKCIQAADPHTMFLPRS